MKEKIIEYLKANTVSIFILILICLYLISRYAFAKSTVSYRDSANQGREELEQQITEVYDKLDTIESKIDKLLEEEE